MHAKNKKISLMLEHLKTQFTSFEFNSTTQPLQSLTIDEVKFEGGKPNIPTNFDLEFIDAPI